MNTGTSIRNEVCGSETPKHAASRLTSKMQVQLHVNIIGVRKSDICGIEREETISNSREIYRSSVKGQSPIRSTPWGSNRAFEEYSGIVPPLKA